MVVNATFNNISYIMAINFIGGGNKSTGEKHQNYYCPVKVTTMQYLCEKCRKEFYKDFRYIRARTSYFL